VTADEEGRTRVRDRYVVTAPVTGRITRIELEPGARVRRGDVIAHLRPERPALLDARARSEALAAVDGANAALGRARAEEQRARAAVALARGELTRSRSLYAAGAASAQDLERREADLATAAAIAEAAAFAERAALAEVAGARARLAPPAASAGDGVIAVVAPVDGAVITRIRESESLVPAGEPIVVIANPLQLEVVVPLLSTDAVRVRPGTRATLENWGGDGVLGATVRLIEPAGFTRTSALGVDEQRVNVVLDLDDSAVCAELGDAYRVDARLVLWESPDALRVPTGAIFRDGGRWAVFVASDGRARRTFVELGHRTGQEAHVLSGLAEGTTVIVHPSDLVLDGVRIRPRDQHPVR
jgi:HlyD family secretion protein